MKSVTHAFSSGRFARTLIDPVNWLFCRNLDISNDKQIYRYVVKFTKINFEY